VPVEPSLVGELVVKVEWFDLLFGSRGHPDQPQPGLWRDNKADRQGAPDEGTFRTLCVRLCEAMRSTSPSAAGHLAQSSAETRRAASTAAPHRHGYSSHRNPDQTVDDLVDIERRAYRNLPTALLYRSRYIADCTCRGNPWDEVSIARHRSYAKLHKQTVSDKTAAALPSVKSERRAKRSDHWAQTG
jgi:hypothetical protein